MILGQWGTLGVFGSEAPPETIGFFLNLNTNLFDVNGLRQCYDKPLPVGAQDSYTLTLDKDWIDSEEIELFNASCDGALITPLTVNDNVLQFAVSGVSSGTHEVSFNWSTASRSGAYQAGLRVV